MQTQKNGIDRGQHTAQYQTTSEGRNNRASAIIWSSGGEGDFSQFRRLPTLSEYKRHEYGMELPSVYLFVVYVTIRTLPIRQSCGKAKAKRLLHLIGTCSSPVRCVSRAS